MLAHSVYVLFFFFCFLGATRTLRGQYHYYRLLFLLLLCRLEELVIDVAKPAIFCDAATADITPHTVQCIGVILEFSVFACERAPRALL